jgi:hypothetical protein
MCDISSRVAVDAPVVAGNKVHEANLMNNAQVMEQLAR